MRYSQIRAFHHVAMQGGFSRAAATLNQSQPSLSDHVRKLEQAHDVLLFHRDRRRVRLTPAGEQLFMLTRQFFEAEDQIAEFLGRSRGQIAGNLRIVADSAAHVTAAVGRFRDAHPGVVVTIRSGNTEDVLARLRGYDAEIGVVGNHVPAADLDEVRLGQSEVVAIAARGFLPEDMDRIALSDLPDWPLVFREKGSRTRGALETLARQHRISLSPSVVVDGREALRDVVASGAGIGFISRAELGFDTRLRAIPIAGAGLVMSESVVVLKMRRDLPAIRAFLRFLS